MAPWQSICLAYMRLRAPSAAPAKRAGKDKRGRGDWYKVPGAQEPQVTLTFRSFSSTKHEGIGEVWLHCLRCSNANPDECTMAPVTKNCKFPGPKMW